MSGPRVSLGELISSLPNPVLAKDVPNQTNNAGRGSFEHLLFTQRETKGEISKEKRQAGRDVKSSPISDTSRKATHKGKTLRGAPTSVEGVVATVTSDFEHVPGNSSRANKSGPIDAIYTTGHTSMVENYSDHASQPVAKDPVPSKKSVPFDRADSVSGFSGQTYMQLSRAYAGDASQNLSNSVVRSKASSGSEIISSSTETAKIQPGDGHALNPSLKITVSETSQQSNDLRRSNGAEYSKLVLPGQQSVVELADQAQSLAAQKDSNVRTATAISDQLASKEYSQHRESTLAAKPQDSSQVSNVDNISHSEFVVPLIHQSVALSNADSNNLAAIDVNSLAASISRPLTAGDGSYSLKVALHPADLGHIDAVVTLDNGNLNVSIVVQNQMTQHAISNSLQELQQSLQSSGLNVNVTLHDHTMGSKEDFQHRNFGSPQITGTSGVHVSTIQEPAALGSGQLHIVL